MPYRFVIIDDDPAVRRMLEQIIESHSLGVVLDTAGDGVEGEKAVKNFDPDVVLIDLLMPRQDGIQMLRNLRSHGYKGPFVMISQVTEKELIAMAYREGIEFYIYKPLNLVEVVSVLKKVIESCKMRKAIEAFHQNVVPLLENRVDDNPKTSTFSKKMIKVQKARRLCGELGILGEAGADDLLCIVELLPEANIPYGRMDPNRLYQELAAVYQRSSRNTKSASVKAIEQRIRRAAAASLRHLASIGLEDYTDPRFEGLAGTFFDFQEVRSEMNWLRTLKGSPGRINMKKFIDAFFNELDD